MTKWRLQEYHFDIVHHPGCMHSNVNSLPMLPCHQWGCDSAHVSTSNVAATTVSNIPVLQHHFILSLQQGQLDDARIEFVYKL